MDWKQYVSVVALVVSIISSGLTYGLSKKSAVTSVRPVLIFEFAQPDGWYVRNVGNGPALNVLIATKEDSSDWNMPVRIPPHQKDGRFSLHWIGYQNIRTLGASYTDIAEQFYSSNCTNDLSNVYEGNKLRRWDESDITAHWKLGFPPK